MSLLSRLPPLVYAGRVNCVTGYGGAARHQIHVLRSHGLRLKVVDTGSDGDPDSTGASNFVQSCRRSDPEAKQPRGSIIHLGPNCTANWRRKLPKPHVLVSVWETTRLPAAWVPIINDFDQVWCATQWQADVYVASGVDVAKVRHVPFALDPALYPEAGPILPELAAHRAEGRSIFGSMFQWSERKAPRALIGSYLAAFQHGERVVLVLKAYEGTDAASRVQRHVEEIIHSYQGNGPMPPVVVLSRRLSHDETLAFYRGIDCYVSAHRAEGYCVAPGTPVTVRGGIRPIEDVKVGDEVLSSDGEFHRVLDAPSRQHVGEMVQLRVQGLFAALRLTPNHEVRALRAAGKTFKTFRKKDKGAPELEWVRAGQIDVGDMLFVSQPRPTGNGLPELLDLAAYLPPDKFCADDNHVWSRMGFTPTATKHSYTTLVEKYGHSKHVFERAVRHIRRGTQPLPGTQCATVYAILCDLNFEPAEPVKTRRYVPVDDAFLRFLGVFVADGYSMNGNYIELALNDTTKADLVREMADYCARAFGLDVAVDAGKGGHRLNVRVCGTALAVAMVALCGRGALNKRVPAFLMESPEQAAPFVSGYLRGDGCTTLAGSVSATTVSPILAWQLRHLLAVHGILASVTRHTRNRGLPIHCLCVGGRQLASFVCIFGLGVERKSLRIRNAFMPVPGGFLVRVKSVEREKYAGPVHDLRVEGVHDFECAGVIVHNCLPLAESLLIGKHVIATDWSAPAEFAAGLYHPVAYTMEAPHSMAWQPFYTLDQQWASPDQGSLSTWMQKVYAGTATKAPTPRVREVLGDLVRRAGEAAKAALEDLLR